MPYNDEIMAQRMGEGMASSGAMLFGRRTYEDFYRYWPQQTDDTTGTFPVATSSRACSCWTRKPSGAESSCSAMRPTDETITSV